MVFVQGLNMIFNIVYLALTYVACAYSLYIIGRRNNVRNSWLAFIPVLQYYVIGSICEEYQLLGVRLKKLEWVMCALALLQILTRFSTVFGAGVIGFIAGLIIALIMHKFFYLFCPERAVIYAILCAFGRLPLAVILFLIKDRPMQMSAGAYSYPFANKL